MHGAGTVSVLFVTMVPQTVVSMMSLTPPVMADDVVATLGLPAGAAGRTPGRSQSQRTHAYIREARSRS